MDVEKILDFLVEGLKQKDIYIFLNISNKLRL